jgi:hypothetical protein
MMRGSLVLLVCVAGGVAAAQHAPTSGRTGTFELGSATTGAEVTIDGEKVGTVPLAPIGKLMPGEHTIKIEKPGFAPYIDVFRIERKKPTKLEVQLVPVAGVLRIKANVEAARVYVDGKFIGEVPLVKEVNVGARAIQVSKGGYKDFFQNVSTVAGEDVNLDVVLDELPVGANPYKPPPPPPAKWHQKWWVWTVSAIGVGVVVTAVVVPAYYATRDPTAGYLPVAVHLPSLTLSK